MTNYFEVLFEKFLLLYQFFFLLVHELFEFIELALLDFCQNCRGDDLELVGYFSASNLEVVDLLKVIETVGTTLRHKWICLGAPVVFSNTRFNYLIQCWQMVIEELLLTRAHQLNNVVIVSDNQHYILSQDS